MALQHQHHGMLANRLLPPDPPTIPGGVLNPDPVRPPPLSPQYIPEAATPPGVGVPPAHPFLPRNPPSPPGAYDATDPQLFWMNNRPFFLHRSIGKGGFGEVYRAEMLLPPGMDVGRNPTTGGFISDGVGRIEVVRQQRASDEPVPTGDSSPPSDPAPSTEFVENTGVPDEEVAKALELSEAAPASMSFFNVEEITDNADGTLLREIDHKRFSWCDYYIQFLSSNGTLYKWHDKETYVDPYALVQIADPHAQVERSPSSCV